MGTDSQTIEKPLTTIIGITDKEGTGGKFDFWILFSFFD